MNMNFYFYEWYNNEATIAERALAERASTFELLFEDMLFAPNTPAGELAKVKIKGLDNDWIDSYLDMPPSIQGASCLNIKFIVSEPESGSDGYYSVQEQVICLSPDMVDNDPMLLHEMIHFYESVVNGEALYFHDE